ncbi:prophage CPS-53 integrase [Enterobacter hormaechei]|nr:prophage CPS-53 integrase [Enterobacter hormaechei]
MLTDSKIRAAKPLEKSYKLTDAQGLYLTVSASGSKLWYFRYRFEGKENRLAFGSYPQVTLAKPARSAMLHVSCWYPVFALPCPARRKKPPLTARAPFSTSPPHGTPVA